MIVKLLSGILSLFLTPILGLLSFAIDLEPIAQVFLVIIGYIRAGLGIVNFFLPLNLVSPLLVTVLAVSAALQIYHLVMWILRKIPMVGVD